MIFRTKPPPPPPFSPFKKYIVHTGDFYLCVLFYIKRCLAVDANYCATYLKYTNSRIPD